MAATYAMPKETDAEKAARTAAMQEALKLAAQVPFVTWPRSAWRSSSWPPPWAPKGNTNVVSDAATALYLAIAALKSAIVNVNVNLKFIKDEAFVAEWAARRDALLATPTPPTLPPKPPSKATLGVTL